MPTELFTFLYHFLTGLIRRLTDGLKKSAEPMALKRRFSPTENLPAARCQLPTALIAIFILPIPNDIEPDYYTKKEHHTNLFVSVSGNIILGLNCLASSKSIEA